MTPSLIKIRTSDNDAVSANGYCNSAFLINVKKFEEVLNLPIVLSVVPCIRENLW